MEPRKTTLQPLQSNDDILILQLLDIVAERLRQLLTQGMVVESSEHISQLQTKIDRLRIQLERLRVLLRKAKDTERRKKELRKGSE